MKKDTKADMAYDKFDACLGSVIGAFGGDAAGGPLEFTLPDRPKEIIDMAMKMGGGGNFGLGKGQVTDDSEMGMSLAWAMYECGSHFDSASLVKFYSAWFESGPFGRQLEYYPLRYWRDNKSGP